VDTLNPYIFRAYDVRGKVGRDITPPVFELVGRAYGTLVSRRGGRTVALGMDNRISSTELKAAFGAGVLSTGVDVVDIGVNHTPLLYFAAAHWGLDGGATVTGSHNPVSDNGVKMVHAGAAPLTEDEIQGLLASIRTGDFERGSGRSTARDPREDYLGAITGHVRLARRLKVVVDAGNGIAGAFAPEPIRVNGMPHALITSGSRDPATPVAGSRRVAAQLGGRYLPAEGFHALYLQGNRCVREHAHRYLTTGQLPPPTASC